MPPASIQQLAAFSFFAALAVVSALATVMMRNPIRNAVGLFVHVLSLAGLYVSLSAHFLTAVQLIVAQRLRGRVMAVRLMVYMVSTPIGALLQGALSDHVGPRATMVVAGLGLLVVGAFFALGRGARLLARVDDPEDLC